MLSATSLHCLLWHSLVIFHISEYNASNVSFSESAMTITEINLVVTTKFKVFQVANLVCYRMQPFNKSHNHALTFTFSFINNKRIQKSVCKSNNNTFYKGLSRSRSAKRPEHNLTTISNSIYILNV